jgi:hypothetical protein
MSSTKNPGRLAGLLYVLFSIPGVFAMVYVPSKLIVHGNAAATANNMASWMCWARRLLPNLPIGSSFLRLLGLRPCQLCT